MTENPSMKRQIKLAVEVLKKDGIVAYPTDTVYGLGADPLNEKAVARIYEVKNRPRNSPLPLLLADKSDLLKVSLIVPEIAWRLVEQFWPGGLTLVVKKSDWVPDSITAGGDTVGVRVPDHPVTIALIRGLGNPIVGTSANLSGKPSPVTAQEVRAQLGNKVDLIVDGGRCPGGIESTVVDISSAFPVIVREGAIPADAITQVCGTLLTKP
ncbi:MAG: threonylcarbamoyl-AMP synthase [Chloroflexi bacterium]|nr:threonylcarbamoyl-AMP synthase [Chloroflexota bacterium]